MQEIIKNKTESMKTLSILIAGLALVFAFSFAFAAIDPTRYTKLEGVDVTSCANVPAAKWATATGETTDACWVAVKQLTGVGDLLAAANKAANWILVILLFFGLFYGLMGAFEFVTSAGNDEKLSAGKKKIYYSLGGVVLGLLVKGLIVVITNFASSL